MAAHEPWFRRYEAAAERAARREVEELPVHELAMAMAAEHWFDAISPFGFLGGDDRG